MYSILFSCVPSPQYHPMHHPPSSSLPQHFPTNINPHPYSHPQKPPLSSLTSCKSTSSEICHSSATSSSQPNCPSSSISSRLNVHSFSVVNSIKSTSLSCKSSSLKILHFNTRSLLPKLDDLAVIYSSSFPDIVCISEY